MTNNEMVAVFIMKLQIRGMLIMANTATEENLHARLKIKTQ